MKKKTKKETDIQDYSNRLKELREKKGFTQLQMQMKTGIDQSEISKIERGVRQPTLEQVFIFSEFFETNIEYICKHTDDPTPFPRKIKTNR